MKKIWRVFVYEYFRHVLRKRFIFALLSLPFFILLSAGVGVLGVLLSMDRTPVGYVDHSGLITAEPPTQGGAFSNSPILRFDDEMAALEALDARRIQGYYVIEADYLETGETRLVADELVSDNGRDAVRSLIRYNLLSSQPEPVAARLSAGPELEIRATEGERKASEQNWLGIAVPIVAGIFLIVVVNTSGGYLLQAVVEEKENRTMEIVITSLSPGQLMAGKIAGNLSVGLTQLVIWVSFPLITFLVMRNVVPFIRDLTLDPQYVFLMVATLLPAFVLVAAIMATVGSTATETREAQQVAGMFTLPIAAPFWFVSSIMTNPNGPIAVGMSLFPLTAPVTLPLRAAFTSVPVWQSALSIALLWIMAGAAVWFAGRAFRLGMLRYGKALTWKELFRRA